MLDGGEIPWSIDRREQPCDSEMLLARAAEDRRIQCIFYILYQDLNSFAFGKFKGAYSSSD